MSVLTTKKYRTGARRLAMSVMVVAIGAIANHAKAAPSIYFDKNGTTAGSGVASAGSYSWESAFWTTSSTGVTATGAFVEGDFARFAAGTDGTTKSYTITASSNHTIGGMFLQSNGGGTVTINGPGVLSIDPTGGPLQGFLINSSTQALKINAVLSGDGGVEQELSGAISLLGNNSYTGGTETTGGQNLTYNNNNSFGTGLFSFTGNSGQGIINAGPAGVTIANDLSFVGKTTATVNGNTTTNFASGHGLAGAPGAIWTGAVSLPTVAGTTTIQTGSATDVTEFRGVISGPSTDPIVVSNLGTLILSGANTYSGMTTITGTATLKLGAAGTIASSSGVVLASGTLNPDGVNQIMSATTLGMTASSTIDYAAGASEVDFANSSALAWTGTLNLANWDPSVDKLRFDSSPSGLTSDQLANIEFNGAGLGTASLDANGFVIVPEPSAIALLGIGTLGLIRKRRA